MPNTLDHCEGPMSADAKKPNQETQPATPPNLERWYMPKIWHGMTFLAWVRLLRSGRFRVAPTRLPLATMITLFSASNSLYRTVQSAYYGKTPEQKANLKAPIFVLGHWRSGTTMLHELLASDPNYAAPNTYECFSPNHFLLSEDMVSRFFGWLLPAHRIPDRMKVGWKSPQEDEAALCNRGVPSPYWKLAFPNQPLAADDYVELDRLSEEQRANWIKELSDFMALVSYKHQSRKLVLKSPTHTFRIKHLLAAFPDAKFVYVVRDPRKVVPSTIHLWNSLFDSQGLHQPNPEGIEDYVFEMFERMDVAVEAIRDHIPANQFSLVRYEDLVQAPIESMISIYRNLELPVSEAAISHWNQYLDARSDYKTNRYSPPEVLMDRILAECGSFMERFGYLA